MTAKNVNPKIKPVKKTTAAPSASANSSVKKSGSFLSFGSSSANSEFSKHLPWVLIAILFLLLSLVYFPVAFQGKEPQASDITQWQGASNAISEYNKQHQDQALWTPNMFSGMPAYMISFPNRYPFLESITRLTDKVISWRIFLLFMGGLGIFLLIRHLKLSPWIAFFGAIAFVFSCHWVGLIEIGHNTKFRAIMYIPWVFWALLRLRDKPNLLNLGLLATFMITQLRENHPQITYYLYLFVGMYWLFGAYESLKDKNWKPFGMWSILVVAAFGLTALAVMNPYLSTLEYSHFTMRGGAAGLEKSYGQAWSFPPLELISLVIPDFFGGINQNYWGFMPFTQIYNYFGVVVLALGVIAIFGKHRRFAIFLWLSSFIFTLMSFGSFTPGLSDLFLNILPYFNKFRVPSMILTMVQINAVVLAALGIDSLLDKQGDKHWQKSMLHAFWICGAIFMLYLLAAKGIFKALPFTTAAEIANFKANNALSQLDGVKAMRLGLLVKSGIVSLLFLTVALGLSYKALAKSFKPAVYVLLITLLCFIDLFIYTGKHLKDVHPVSMRVSRFQMQDYDQFMLQDKDNYRVYPFNMNSIRPAGEWAYFHQSVDGYSAAKLKRYDDVLKLIQGDAKTDGEFVRYLKEIYSQKAQVVEKPMPVLDMLAVKYIAIPDSLPYANQFALIKPVFVSNSGVHLYRNQKALPRAWFVDSLEVVTEASKILERLGNPNFDPRKLALVEQEIPRIQAPDSSYVKQSEYGLQSLKYEVFTNKDAYMVLSEVYYPAGWKAYLDGKLTQIYPTNYILRGVVIPSGKHTLEMRFMPDSYQKSLVLSLSGLLITILAVIGGFLLQYKNKLKHKENDI